MGGWSSHGEHRHLVLGYIVGNEGNFVDTRPSRTRHSSAQSRWLKVNGSGRALEGKPLGGFKGLLLMSPGVDLLGYAVSRMVQPVKFANVGSSSIVVEDDAGCLKKLY